MKQDPIIPAAASWRAALASSQSLDGREDVKEPELFQLMDEECRAAIAALQTTPSTLPGLRAFCEMGVAMSADALQKGEGMGDWTPGLPLGLHLPTGEEMFFATLSAAVSKLLPTTTSVDPVFAAIERHTALWVAHGEAITRTDDACEQYGGGSAEMALAEQEQSDACDLDVSGRSDFVATVPTTTAGMVAYVGHLSGVMCFRDSIPSDEDFDALMRTFQTFAQAQEAGR